MAGGVGERTGLRAGWDGARGEWEWRIKLLRVPRSSGGGDEVRWGAAGVGVEREGEIEKKRLWNNGGEEAKGR